MNISIRSLGSKVTTNQLYNGLRYLRWGVGKILLGCRKNSTAGKMFGMTQNPQHQVYAVLRELGFLEYCSC